MKSDGERTIGYTEARKVAKILLAYANRKTIQHRKVEFVNGEPTGRVGPWSNGKLPIDGKLIKLWLRTHRIKPKAIKKRNKNDTQ